MERRPEPSWLYAAIPRSRRPFEKPVIGTGGIGRAPGRERHHLGVRNLSRHPPLS